MAVSPAMMAIIRVVVMALEEDSMVIMNVVAVLIKEETCQVSAEHNKKDLSERDTITEIFLIKLTTF